MFILLKLLRWNIGRKMKRDVMILELDFGKKLGAMQKMGVKALGKALENKFKDGIEQLANTMDGEEIKVKTNVRIEERE